MKKLILSFIILAAILGSCCRGGWEIAVIEVRYPNIMTTSSLMAIRTERIDLAAIVDTISLRILSQANSYSALIEFDDNPLNYIVWLYIYVADFPAIIYLPTNIQIYLP